MPDPEPGPGELLVDALALGVCGTDRSWLEALISRRVPLDDFQTAVEKLPNSVKVVLEL
jgi:threonine dehydrogenase-like Zn-dependent dehydrogenase